MKATTNDFNPVYSEESPTPEEVSAAPDYAIIEFGAPWCGHCKAAESAVKEALSKKGLPHIKIYDGKGKPLGRSFGVKLWPTLILLHNGREVSRLVRPTTTAEVEQLLSKIGD